MSWFDVLNSLKWSLIADSVRNLCGFQYTEDGVTVDRPHIGRKYGHALRGLIAALEGYSLSVDDDYCIERAKKMMSVYEKEWKKIGKHCDAAARARKEDEVTNLPVTSDVVKMKEYCVAEINRLCDQTLDNESYVSLQKAVITRLITFNARRGGEPGKLKVSQWPTIKEGKGVLDEETQSLSVEEQLLAKSMKLGYVVGKGKRKVSILFLPETVRAIDLLILDRPSYFSNKENKYVFGRIFKMSKMYLRGSDCVREVGCEAKLNHTQYITATQMRKYLATMLQLLDMSEPELRWITDHLGHSVDVHKKWYRVSNKAVELTKVASVLVAAESGFLQRAHNVPFDNISTANTQNTDDCTLDDVGTPDEPAPNDTVSDDACTPDDTIPDDNCTTDDTAGQTCEYLSGPSVRKRTLLCDVEEDASSDSDEECVPSKMIKLKPKKKKQVHIPWSKQEKDALFVSFPDYLHGRSAKLPGKAAIGAAQSKYNLPQKRGWLNIKFQLKNLLKYSTVNVADFQVAFLFFFGDFECSQVLQFCHDQFYDIYDFYQS
ncbi:hypothetical protein MAR_003585 [Mya arenaria]|uniref:Uncharacterized protein n=1 Tax=Mya arenaria TaxID=6604 RepID=A0ABY7G7W7_MYAAR|nr:hypothetical protein MAR_003585 [Mya arenaria]